MGINVRGIALGALVTGALLCVSPRNLNAEDPADGVPAVASHGSVAEGPEKPNADGPNNKKADAAAPIDPASAGSGADAASANAVTAVAQKGFWARLAQAYYDDWHPAATSEAPKYRGYPMPESNPPYPFSEWPIGGTVTIGYPNATSYPLTAALYGSRHWEWLKKANIQIYGWANAGMNLSTSTESQGGKYANAPAGYNQIPNSIQLDQLTVYVERVPDTVQTDHFDWGFRFTGLYGLDYRFTTADGYFSQQLLHYKKDGTLGNQYGADPVMFYLDL